MGKIISDLSVILWFLLTILVAIKSERDCNMDVDNMLETILDPGEASLQRQALRTELIRRVKEALQRENLENELVDYKRSLSSLAKWGNLPGKRNLESLARAGYIRTLPDDDSNFKRSISSLARTGQLPLRYYNEDIKRGIQSLARNGELHYKRENQQDDDYNEDYDKRNIASLARGYNFPLYKRNIASLAREGMMYGKRNAAALLRQDNYLNGIREGRDESHTEKPNDQDKRNIGNKIKRSTNENGKRQKRSVDYLDDFEDSNAIYPDYEEMVKGGFDGYENPEKRFLGSVAKTGWFRPSVRFVTANKRHIGSLARLGWLPALRSARRFNRSGRSSNVCDSRTFTSDGQIQDNSISEIPLDLMEKNYAIPKIFMRFRNM